MDADIATPPGMPVEPPGLAGDPVLVVGDEGLALAACSEFKRLGVLAVAIAERDADTQLRTALTAARSVVIATRSDGLALKLVLLVRDLAPDLDVVVTAFDRTLAAELGGPELRCRVVASADLIAAAIAGPCAEDGVDALDRHDGGIDELRADRGAVHRTHRGHRLPRPARIADRVIGMLRPYDVNAQILVTGLLGLLAMLVVDFLLGVWALDEDPLEALYLATRTLTTVSGNDALAYADGWVRAVAIATMLGGLASIALFSAGMVSRLVDRRRVGIVGRRALPVRDHVIIVGMGQIGLRTALLLREAGIAVVGVERDPDAIGVRLGARYRLPIVIAAGEDRELLDRLHVRRARCVAAVTSDDLMNIEIAMAARANVPGLRVVLRAGDGEIARETRSLLHLGTVRDAHRIVAVGLVSASRGRTPTAVVPLAHEGEGWTVHETGESERWTRGTAGRVA